MSGEPAQDVAIGPEAQKPKLWFKVLVGGKSCRRRLRLGECHEYIAVFHNLAADWLRRLD